MKTRGKYIMAAAVAAIMANAAVADDYYGYETASALSGLYVRGDIGAAMLNWSGGKDDTGVLFGIGVGGRFNPYLRADVRYTRAGKFKVGGGTDLTANSVLGNIYFDLPLHDWPLRPYLGAGLGYGWAEFSPGSDDSGAAAAFMAGLTYEINQNLVIDAGYRFHDIMVSGPDVTDHQLMIGMRYHF